MRKRYYGLNRVLLILFLSALILIPFWAAAEASQSIGKVVALRGVVNALDINQKTRQLKLKDPVFLSETIVTRNGRVQLMFQDSTLMTLGRNTTMVIQEYLWESGHADSKMKTFIKEGSFRVMGGVIAKDAPQNFKTETPAATIGIRGSMYAGLFEKNNLIVVFEGGQGIFVENGSNQVDIDIPGFGTEASTSDQTIKKPEKFNQDDLNKIENALASTTTPDDSTDETVKEGSDSEPEVSDTEEDAGNGDGIADNTGDENSEEASTPNEDQASETESDETVLSESGFSDQSEVNPMVTSEQDSSPSGSFDTDISTITSEAASGYTDTTKTSDTGNTSEGIITSMLSDLGYTGSKSTSVPSTGITYYKGKLLDHDEQIIDNSLTVAVNWLNGRLFAYENETESQGYMSNGLGYGSVGSDGTIKDVVVIGTESHGDIVTMSMSETFAQFYGSGPDALGIAMEGFDINIKDQNLQTPMKEYLAATFDSTGNTPAASGPWEGFFVGVTEDMDSPNSNRRVFINENYNTANASNAAQDFSISLDEVNGRLDGTLKAKDFTTGGSNSMTLGIGSSSDDKSSVYVDTKLAAAKLSGTSIMDGSASRSLKEYGNFLVVSNDISLESGNNTVWGYWEIAYKGESGRDYHTHVPGSLWIAGVRNTISVYTGFTGSYTGTAKGVRFSDSYSMGDLEDGSVSLNIDFDTHSVTGNIDFTSAWGTNFIVGGTSSSVNNTGFSAEITSINSGAMAVDTTSHVNGAFYGTNAESIGGSFSVKGIDTDNTRYEGIFAGNDSSL